MSNVPDEIPLNLATRERIGIYQIIDKAGRGGTGTVYKAYDERRGRYVALKLPHFAVDNQPELLERFTREAKLIVNFEHKHLVKMFGAEIHDETWCLVSHWCDGGDLARWLRKNPGPQNAVWSARLISQISRAVHYCHTQQVLHLDIKPANIVFENSLAKSDQSDPDDTWPDIDTLAPKLTDFGIARVIEEGLVQSSTMIVGTPMYMAPEQAEHDRSQVGPQTDVFALGLVLYELIYGRRAFNAISTIQVIDQVRSIDTLRLSADGGVPDDLVTICERCLQYRPCDRYSTAASLADDLDRFVSGQPIHARRVSSVERFKRWATRDQRVADAVSGTWAIQVLLSLWVLLGVAALGNIVDVSEVTRSRIDLLATIVMITIPLTFCVSFARRWGEKMLWISLAIAMIGQVFTPAVVLLGWVDMMVPVYRSQTFFKTTNFGLILFAGLCQTFLLIPALAAMRSRNFTIEHKS